jgi:hypothetical protein
MMPARRSKVASVRCHRHAGPAGRRGNPHRGCARSRWCRAGHRRIHDLFPWLRHLFADSAYSGGGLDRALTKFGHWTIEVIRRSADVAGFAVLPRRWVVERTLAWLAKIGANRHLISVESGR